MTYEELIAITNSGVEIWKPIVGYEDYYEVSNFGRVKSVDRYVFHTARDNGHRHHVAEKIKKSTINAKGYPCVTLCKNRKSVQWPIHRLLMEAFVPKPKDKYEIDHINTVKTDCRLVNLRWVTHKENMTNNTTLEHFSVDANNEKQKEKRLETRKINGGITAPVTVYQYTKNGTFIAKYTSSLEAQKITGIHCTGIRRALDNSTLTAGGFMWFTAPQNNIVYERKLPKNTKPIVQCDLAGVPLHKWKSLQDAASALNININAISKSLKNGHPYKGYLFKLG